jgi:dTDP-4-dehydrorhamnose reductase
MTVASGAGNAGRMKIAIVGAGGQLGQAMAARFSADHTVTALTRQDLDLTRARLVHDTIRSLAPDVVINCAGYNNLDQAQNDQEAAMNANAFAVGTLARAAAELDAVLLHYSSDFVFAGTATSPYTELDRPEPQSVYAQSKLVGEWLAADAPKHYVLRVESLFGGPKRRSSIDRIADAVRRGDVAPVFVDRVVSPSFVNDVVEASAHVLRAGPAFGVYHCVNTGHATWLEVGREIARRLGKTDTALKPVSVNDVALTAPRPQFAALSNARLAEAGFTMPSWQDAIARYLDGLADA